MARAALKELGWAFSRQHAFEVDGKWYILDFYLWRHGVCLEIDGLSHRSEGRKGYDFLRDRRLKDRGILTARVDNELMHNVMQATFVIKKAVTDLIG